MKSLFFIFQIAVGLLSTYSFSQTFQSAISLGEGGRSFASDIAQTPSGDIIVIGATTGVTNFNPKGNPHNIASPGEIHLANAFIARYNKDMELQWVNSLGFDRWEMANELVLDEDENIYVMGYGSRIDFDPSVNEEIWNFAYGESFIVKYGSDGAFKACNVVTGHERLVSIPGGKIMLDHLGNVYTHKGFVLSKYNSNLELQWRKEIGGIPEFFNESEIYCIRSFTDFVYRPKEAQKEIVLERYDLSTCNLIDTILLGYTTGAVHNGFIKKTKNNDLLICGKYWGDLSIYGNGDTVKAQNHEPKPTWELYESKDFICRYDDVGSLIWAKVFEDRGPSPSLLETDEEGNIYAFGNIRQHMNFDPINPKLDIPLVKDDFYIAKYDHEFNYQAKHQFSGTRANIHRFRLYDDIALMAGSFSTPIDLDLTSSVNFFERHNNEDLGNAAFMARFSDFDLKNNAVHFGGEAAGNNYFDVVSDPSRTGKNIQIYLNSEHKSIGLTRVTVYDLRGKLLKSVQSNQDIIPIDISEHAHAPYLIRVTNNKWSATEKILKFD